MRALAVELPNDPYYTASLAIVLIRRRSPQAASRDFIAALDQNPPYDYGHHMYEKARLFAALGHDDEAIALLKRASSNGFRFAFVGGIGGTALAPDGRPHLDPVFDHLAVRAEFQELARGKD